MNVHFACLLLVILSTTVTGNWCNCEPPLANFSPLDEENNSQPVEKSSPEEIENPEEKLDSEDDEPMRMNEEHVQEDKASALKLPVINMLKELINTTQSCEVPRNFEVPAIEENSSSYFLGQGGHFMFTLSFGDPAAVGIKIRDSAVFITAPLRMDNLVFNLEEVNILVEGQNDEYNIELKFDVIKNISVTLTLVAYKKQNKCDKAVFDFKLNDFQYTLNFLDNIKNLGLSKRVKKEMWVGIMSKVRRTVEIYSLYLMRRAFQGLGTGFGDELCLIKQ